MESISTALRAFFTRRLDPKTVYSYGLLLGLVMVTAGALLLLAQLTGG